MSEPSRTVTLRRRDALAALGGLLALIAAAAVPGVAVWSLPLAGALCLAAVIQIWRHDPRAHFRSIPAAAREQRELPPGLDSDRLLKLTEVTAGVGYWIVDLERQQLHWSDAVFRIHGYEPGEIAPQVGNAIDFYHPDDRAAVESMVAQAISSGASFEFVKRLIRKDGEIVWVASHGRCLRNADGDVSLVFGTFRDITEEHRRMQELEENRKRLLFATDGGGDGVWEWHPPEHRMHISPTGLRMLGYEPEDFDGSESAWMGRVHPADLERVVQAFTGVANSPAGGNYLNIEYRIGTADGGWRWIRARGLVTERDRDGKAVQVFGTQNDIQALREALETAQEASRRLKIANRDLEGFAYIASHDLQAPLRTIASYAQLLERRYAATLGEEGREFLQFIHDGAAHMKHLITDLLEFSRAGSDEIEYRRVDLGEVVDEATRALESQIRETGAQIHCAELPPVQGSRAQLLRLMQNLLTNAMTYHRDGVPPRIQIAARRRNGRVEVSVQDNGIGIPAESREQIFAIFRRLHTQDQYPGTGIGLAVCKRIVERHGGELHVDSEVGVGSCFRFDLPAQGVTGDG